MLRSVFILSAVLTSCSPDETVSGQTNAEEVWTLTSMNEVSIHETITIAFPEEGRIEGRAPCNRYFASQKAPLPWFEVKAIGATKMACPSLKLEQTYFENLQKMTTAEIAGDTLILKSDTGETLVYKNN